MGQEHWIKTEDSLARKIRGDMERFGLSADEAAGRINDVLRHTITHPSGEAAVRAEAALEAFEAYGYKVVREANSWVPGSPYKGLNVVLEDPHGYRFEVQFHTPESYSMKTETHALYDIVRDEALPLEVRQRAYDESVRLSAELVHPPGIERIGTPKLYRRPE